MKSKILINRFALSTVLLSAVAFPSVSNADSPSSVSSTTSSSAPSLIAVSEVAAPAKATTAIQPSAWIPSTKSDTVTLSVAQAAPVVTSFTSPVELAEKYAPDTVEAWKSTLAQYDRLVQKHTSSITFVPTSISPDVKADESVQVQITTATKAAKAAPTLEPTSFVIMDEKDATVTLDRIESVEAQPAKLVAYAAGTVTIQSSDSDSDLAFLKAEIALAKAAESKDAEVIKRALSQLMGQYKTQITELEQASE